MERDSNGVPFEIVSRDVGGMLRRVWSSDDVDARFVPVEMYANLKPVPHEFGSIVIGRGMSAQATLRILVVE